MLAEPTLPTPLRRAPEIGGERVELWIKNDGLSHPAYGGNKVRKVERALAEAKRRGARRVLTMGAVGSHHVLTTALFARAAGLRCAAVLIPQPSSAHVVDTIRASLAQGLEPYCVDHSALAPLRIASAWRPGDYFIPPGGSDVNGALSYVEAVGELVQQLREQGSAPPDWIIVPVGSGGTCAGIAAGVMKNELPTRVLGVQTIRSPVPAWVTKRLTRALLQRLSLPAQELPRVLAFDASQAGAGYGHATAAGDAATLEAKNVGLELDPTYTAKTFAAVLEHVRRAPAGSVPLRLLYWHTLSAVPLVPLLQGAPDVDELPPRVKRLLVSA
ncbi:MAG TPA: pyridoxal-phosphate dependent enzyme [Polyangiaceae bacterium]|nr:pyridoxal-phosphate dependent enzyme [Polyangiaceae bacterium]